MSAFDGRKITSEGTDEMKKLGFLEDIGEKKVLNETIQA